MVFEYGNVGISGVVSFEKSLMLPVTLNTGEGVDTNEPLPAAMASVNDGTEEVVEAAVAVGDPWLLVELTL